MQQKKGGRVMAVRILFQPSGRRIKVRQRETVLETIRQNGLEIRAVCGGHGTCGKCKVRVHIKGRPMQNLIREGAVNPLTWNEKKCLTLQERQKNFRLACCLELYQDGTVEIPTESRTEKGVIVERGRRAKFLLNPRVHSVCVMMSPPSLEDFRSDEERLCEAVAYETGRRKETIRCRYGLLLRLPALLRKCRWRVQAVFLVSGETTEIIDAGPVPETEDPELYGMAVDLGTTTIAASLADLSTGRVLARRSCMNGQICCGDDVVSRISHVMMHSDGLRQLAELVRQDIERLAGELAKKAGIRAERIYELIVAGNTVMEHLFLGLDPERIGKSPFVSVLRRPVTLPAGQLGLKVPQCGDVFCLPIEAGFVGADNVAVLLAERLDQQPVRTMVIDIGTNGEIDYGDAEGIWSTSCATGPALEGAEISCGMRAAPGAIERVRIDATTGLPSCRVIGGGKPKGICGSGIIDVIAEFVRCGLIRPDGTFCKEADSPRLRPAGRHSREFVLATAGESGTGKELVITQKDVRAVQLAKGALYAGAVLLIRAGGGKAPKRILLAGAFGSYIDKENACRIRMFPPCPGAVIESIGNAASEGALAALFDRGLRDKAGELSRQIRFVEAASQTDFQRLFFEGTMFPDHSKEK